MPRPVPPRARATCSSRCLREPVEFVGIAGERVCSNSALRAAAHKLHTSARRCAEHQSSRVSMSLGVAIGSNRECASRTKLWRRKLLRPGRRALELPCRAALPRRFLSMRCVRRSRQLACLRARTPRRLAINRGAYQSRASRASSTPSRSARARLLRTTATLSVSRRLWSVPTCNCPTRPLHVPTATRSHRRSTGRELLVSGRG
jgi:hypothetical protein